jgi:hypothetical protein
MTLMSVIVDILPRSNRRSARKYLRSRRAPSQVKVAHTWRTRADPFAEMWPQILALLDEDAGLEAKTVWVEMNERYPGRFNVGQLRTLQRRFQAWRGHGYQLSQNPSGIDPESRRPGSSPA